MRREHIQAVSSALLLTFVVFIPHHIGCTTSGSEVSSIIFRSGPLISEFYPRGSSNDEYIVLSNQGGTDVNLRGWRLSDGEGVLTFSSDIWLVNGSSFTISWNGSSFWQAYARLPEISLDAAGSERVIQASGSFRLADAGDSLALCSPGGRLEDAVIYGSTDETSDGWSGSAVPALKKGEVAKRISSSGSFIDTDSMKDWMPFREYRYGYTDLGGEGVEVASGNITAFASPDNSQDVVLSSIGQASKSICACAYELSSVPFTDALIEAKHRGTDVRILVDGAPSGGMSREEIACLSVLALAGIDVRAIKGNTSAGVIQHVGAVHAKYLVIDSSTTIVMSENLVEQGIPTDRVFGNRGWGVAVRDPRTAMLAMDLFEADSRLSRLDVIPWSSDPRHNISAEMPKAPAQNHTQELFEPLVTSEPARVTLCISPDVSIKGPYLAELVECARTFVGEQFQADLWWKQRWDDRQTISPLVSALESCLRRGGSARLLLDSSWYNVPSNGAVVDSLRENGTFAGMDGEFGLLDSASPIATLHNKGVIIDGRTALVSSNNWVHASFARNRELGVLIDSVEVADYFGAIFESDWVPDRTPPVADAGEDIELAVGESATISSRGSYDDRVVSSVSWDTDGDGIPESWNRSIDYMADVPGDHRLLLTVEDSWGNVATDELVVSVVDTDRPRRAGHGGLIGLEWAVPVVLAAAYVALRRRSRPAADTSPRKLNHRPKV
jgi:phosphatidylserine/phosphatidylglycerophosphate/cardiolipin synthase-like enzyme